MVLARWNGALVVAIAWAGLAWGQSAAPAQPAAKSGVDLLTVQEADKPTRKCLILKSWQQPQGSLAFEVQCLESAERLTIVEMGPEDSAARGSSQGMRSRIYHWGDSDTPPPGVPQPPAEQPAQPVTPSAPAATAGPVSIIKSVEGLSPMPGEHPAKQETPSAVANIPVVNDKAPLSGAKLGPIETEMAKPSDWHRSWGKADDHKSHLEHNKAPQAQPVVPAVTSSDLLKDQAMSVADKKDVVLTGGDGKAASPESAPEAVLGTAPKPGPGPAGYVSITDIPPHSKSPPEAKKPAKMFLVGFLKPSKMDQEIRPGSAVAVPSPQAMPPVSAVQDPHHLQNVLSNDLMPSRREKAAEILSAMDWHQNNGILAAILKSAGEDPAATVRAACVRSLMKMKADSLETIHLLQSLRADADPRVRGEAEQALAALGVPQANADDQPVHQISAPGIGEPK